jgi:two-component system, OmpR family, response regulator
MTAKLLILEDDAPLRGLLVRTLREEGFSAEGVGTGTALLERAAVATPDAFVIDIGLPDADGRDVCLALRARGVQAPVLFLTARANLVDRLSGFSSGGDDYLAKPFAFEELIARLESLIRRRTATRSVAAGLDVDAATHALVFGARSVPLTPTELRIMSRLISPGGVVERDELMAAAWPRGTFVNPNTLDAYIARLRRKMASLDADAAINTVHGVGYELA